MDIASDTYVSYVSDSIIIMLLNFHELRPFIKNNNQREIFIGNVKASDTYVLYVSDEKKSSRFLLIDQISVLW